MDNNGRMNKPMIPKVIWQTHEYEKENLPLYMQAAIGTWTEQNPDFVHRYISGSERRQFIAEGFGEQAAQIYDRGENNVVKADIWRLFVMYKHGGIYADIDTYCMAPIETFMQLDGSTFICEQLFFIENKINTNNSVFATVPNGAEIDFILNTFIEWANKLAVNNKLITVEDSGPRLYNEALTLMSKSGLPSTFKMRRRGFPSLSNQNVIWSYSPETSNVLTPFGSTGWNDISHRTLTKDVLDVLQQVLDNGIDIKISKRLSHHL